MCNVIKNIRPDSFELIPGGFTIKRIPNEGGGEEESPARILERIFKGYAGTLKLLPPLVLAKTKWKKGAFTLCFRAVFAVRLKEGVILDKENFNLYMKNTWTGTDFTPEFLMDFSSVENKYEYNFSMYQVDFKLKYKVAPNILTTYVWNEDPVGSRGTETAVQKG